MTKQYLLVRSPRVLISDNLIGIGWKNVRFIDYENADELISKGFIEAGVPLGRKKKSIKQYFNLRKGDIVIVPVTGAIAIGVVETKKYFYGEPSPKNSNNRTHVNFYKVGGNPFISRKELEHNLQKRLRVRASIVNFQEFSGEIDSLIESLKQGKMPTWDARYQERMEEKEAYTKIELLKRIRIGNGTSLNAGGDGLERLVKEILTIQGYACQIMAKNQSSGPDDVDIIAVKTHPVTYKDEVLLVQVKHHNRTTGWKGIDQLEKYETTDSESTFIKLLITSGEFDEDNKKKALELKEKIFVIDGAELIELIWDHLPSLSEKTKRELGISDVPALL